MIAQLQKSLTAAGHVSHVYETPDASRLLILPYGARVLALSATGDDHNFFWTNPALCRLETAEDVFAGQGWHNTGGDRTWVTPELDIFFPDYPDTKRHWEPPQLDACEYELLHEAGRIGLKNKMSLHFARLKRDVEMELSKWFEPAPNPLRHEEGQYASPSSLQYAGYTQRTTLKLVEGQSASPVAAGIWNLIQLPHGGELLVPTYSPTSPKVLFGNIPTDRITCDDRLIRFKMDFPGEHKIAVRAAALTGRAGYIMDEGKLCSMVIRNFFVEPSGEYVDVPKDDPEDFGYAFHAVNVHSDLGDFCELEYHAPAIGRYPGQTFCTDVSQVWAYRGSAESIRDIARLLLGADV